METMKAWRVGRLESGESRAKKLGFVIANDKPRINFAGVSV